MAAHVVIPAIHRVFSNLKTWGLGVYHGLRPHHLQDADLTGINGMSLNEYQESGVLQARDYNTAFAKAEKAKPLFDRYGWEECCRQDNVMEVNKGDYIVLRRFMLDIDYYFNEEGTLRR